MTTVQNPALTLALFPLSSKYDPLWVVKNQMGPNVLWLTEWLTRDAVTLKPGMRVLDLACGKALSSIFLVKEFGVEVWAIDRDISVVGNQKRVDEAGLTDSIHLFQGDAQNLPFSKDFFDAIICIDAFEYFGTEPSYMQYLSQFVKPDGQIGIMNASVEHELNGVIPDYLQPLWLDEFNNFHSANWWRKNWEKSSVMDVTTSEFVPGSGKLWLQWEEAVQAIEPSDDLGLRLLQADAGRNLGITCIAGTRKCQPKPDNSYQYYP